MMQNRVDISKEAEEHLQKIISRYPDKQAAMIPVLHVVQNEMGGYLTVDTQKYVADLLEIPPVRVAAVVSFYPMLKTKPVGKYHIRVCNTLSCALTGSRTLVQHLKEKLRVEISEVTGDKRFSIEKVECLASCGTAPVMLVNEDLYQNLTDENVDGILDKLE